MDEYCIYCGPIKTETSTTFVPEFPKKDLSDIEQMKKVIEEYYKKPTETFIPTIWASYPNTCTGCNSLGCNCHTFNGKSILYGS